MTNTLIQAVIFVVFFTHPASLIKLNIELKAHYCCPEFSLFNVESGKCEVGTQDVRSSWLPPWTFSNGTKKPVTEGTIYSLESGFPSCEAYLFRPDISPREDDFFLLPSGHLFFPFYNTSVPPDRSCIVEANMSDENEATPPKTNSRLGPLYLAVVCQGSIPLPGPEKQGTVSRAVRTSLYTATMAVSEVFFLLTLLAYWLVPELLDLQGRTIVCTISSLFMAYLMFIIVNTVSHDLSTGACIGFGLTLHYWMLASFFWLSIVSVTVYMSVTKWDGLVESEERKRFIFLSVVGWTAPLLFTLAALIVDFSGSDADYLVKPHIGEESCWFGKRNAELAYFFGPVTLLVLVNIGLFVASALAVYRKMSGAQTLATDGQHKNKNRLKMCAKLFTVMGVTWIFEVMQFFINDHTDIWILFDMVNMLQGFSIFVVVVLGEKVVRQKMLAALRSYMPGLHRRTKTADLTQLEEDIGQNRRGDDVL